MHVSFSSSPEQEHDEDLLLWQAFRAGQREALGALFDRYAQPLFAYGHHLSRDSEAVKDAIQTVFVRLWQRRDALGEVASVKFYLYRSLKNGLLRSAAVPRRPAQPSPDAYEPSIEQRLVGLEEEHRLATTLQHSLAQLSEREKEIINLKYFDSFKIREIAVLLQLSEQTVSNLLHRALKKLRKSVVLGLWLGLMGLLLR